MKAVKLIRFNWVTLRFRARCIVIRKDGEYEVTVSKGFEDGWYGFGVRLRSKPYPSFYEQMLQAETLKEAVGAANVILTLKGFAPSTNWQLPTYNWSKTKGGCLHTLTTRILDDDPTDVYLIPFQNKRWDLVVGSAVVERSLHSDRPSDAEEVAENYLRDNNYLPAKESQT
jgi:hypothetical protein